MSLFVSARELCTLYFFSLIVGFNLYLYLVSELLSYLVIFSPIL